MSMHDIYGFRLRLQKGQRSLTEKSKALQVVRIRLLAVIIRPWPLKKLMMFNQRHFDPINYSMPDGTTISLMTKVKVQGLPVSRLLDPIQGAITRQNNLHLMPGVLQSRCQPTGRVGQTTGFQQSFKLTADKCQPHHISFF
jgi:hypothetical protein